MAKKLSSKSSNRYDGILVHIFDQHYLTGDVSFEFERREIETAAKKLRIVLPKNIGDLVYSFRFRSEMPERIAKTITDERLWVIELAGRGRYRMVLRKPSRIKPNPGHFRIKIPDATPEIVAAHALNDEQALLAKVRYNRLIDVFLGVAAYSLQNHLRTSVPDIGQIETDEVYVAVNSSGEQFAIPVQAKGGSDEIADVQVIQDLGLCRKAYPQLTPRPVAVQFIRETDDEIIVMFELVESSDGVRVVNEKHYRLVPASEITDEDLRQFRLTAKR